MDNCSRRGEYFDLSERVNALEERRWYDFYRSVIPFILFSLASIIVVNIFLERMILALVEVGLFLYFAATMILVLTKKSQKTVTALFIAGVVLAALLPLHPSLHYTAWYSLTIGSVAPLFMVVGKKKSTIYLFLMYAVLCGVFMSRYSIGENALHPGIQANFYVIFVIIIFISYFNESTKAQYAAALNDATAALDRLSNTDSLTGLRNRRSFDEALDREWHRLSREGSPLSLVLCDIDHFKRYNDSAGHPAGDECLKIVSGVFREAAGRNEDTTARYGGEEFAVLLPGCDAGGALVVAEKLQETLAARAVPHPAFEGTSVTMSIGISTTHPSPGENPGTLIEAADRGLYRSKQDGRNRISVKAASRTRAG